VAWAQGGPSPEAVRRNERGAALLKEGKLEEAVAEFREAAQTDSGYVAALMNLAYAYDRQGQIGEAIAAYGKVLEGDPENSLARNNLAVLYGRQGRHDEAIHELEQVLQRDPPHASAAKNLEVAKRNQAIVRDRDQQLARAVKESEARPADPRAAYAVARLYALHSQTDQALTWLTLALDLGLEDVQSVTVDPALVGLRNDPRFKSLVEGRQVQKTPPR